MSKNNTITRVLVSIAAIPVILFMCVVGEYYFLLLALGISLVAHYEYDCMAKNKNLKPQFVVPFLMNISFVMNSFFQFIDFGSLIILSVILLLFTELFRNRGSAILNVGTALLGTLYIGLCIGSLVGIREFFPKYDYVTGGYLIVSLMASIWLCDSAAFFVGINFGKHRLFERVSPKKSWEGAIGGFIFAVLTMVGAKYLLLKDFSLTDVIIIGAVVGTVGQLGDLAESLLKRDAGVKDSSKLIPGHGGIFDRFDSLIAVGPVVYAYVKYFVLQ